MKFLCLLLVVGAATMFWICQQRIILVETYLLPAKMGYGWVVVEYENPRCGSLKDRLFERRIVIPESGYLCTSSSMYMGWHQARYYLVEEDGRWKRLPEELIRREGSFEVKEYLFTAGAENLTTKCEVKGGSFWYGPGELLELRGDERVLIIKRYHPECR